MQTEKSVDVGMVNLTGGTLKPEESLTIDVKGTLVIQGVGRKTNPGESKRKSRYTGSWY